MNDDQDTEEQQRTDTWVVFSDAPTRIEAALLDLVKTAKDEP